MKRNHEKHHCTALCRPGPGLHAVQLWTSTGGVEDGPALVIGVIFQKESDGSCWREYLEKPFPLPDMLTFHRACLKKRPPRGRPGKALSGVMNRPYGR